MRQVSVVAKSEQDTEAIGAVFAGRVSTPLVMWMSGDLGGGKTTFARGFIHALGYVGRIKSPTYTLLEIYETDALKVLHFDLYRLRDAREFEALGADYLGWENIRLIEWPEKARAVLPACDLCLNFEFVRDGRRVSAAAGSAHGEQLLDDLPVWISRPC